MRQRHARTLALMLQGLESVAVTIVTVSDRVARGERDDTSGPVLASAFTALGAAVTLTVVPDGADHVEAALRTAIAAGARAVITTGGTGVAPRDQTPQGTARVLQVELPGISERLRATDPVPGSALSRGIAGVAGTALVVNVAGSPAAASSAANVLPPIVTHALAQLDGRDH